MRVPIVLIGRDGPVGWRALPGLLRPQGGAGRVTKTLDAKPTVFFA
jgi:hypothetical protein